MSGLDNVLAAFGGAGAPPKESPLEAIVIGVRAGAEPVIRWARRGDGAGGRRVPREEGFGESGPDAHEVPRLRVGIPRERRLDLVHGARCRSL